ncbi:MAG: adenosylcobinamide-GDP ribazoletransferase [Clostridia bacterium]|nr:adenosylcobinamide-GDP ribazoletransferase [Clostridia bacterium]
MKPLILMIQFLTRIPLKVTLDVTDDDFTSGFKYFPVVGSIIGGLIYAIHFILHPYFNGFTLAVILTLSYIYITGGLHMDGLSDSADGLFSGRSKERILEIMKDSRIGSNGALAMVFVVLLKVAFFYEIDAAALGKLLLTLPMMSKYVVVFTSAFSRYAREDGMGNWFIGKVSGVDFLLATIYTIGITTLIEPRHLVLLAGGLCFGWLFRRFCYSHIDGMTGDTIGALSELADVVILCVGALFL